jgi:hypothetical protein
MAFNLVFKTRNYVALCETNGALCALSQALKNATNAGLWCEITTLPLPLNGGFILATNQRRVTFLPSIYLPAL